MKPGTALSAEVGGSEVQPGTWLPVHWPLAVQGRRLILGLGCVHGWAEARLGAIGKFGNRLWSGQLYESVSRRVFYSVK